ncbi:MAG: ribosome silencing factor [Actinomycetota bacterium]
MPITGDGSRANALLAAEAASSKKAGDIVILEVGPLISITDYFVICSGNTERQVKTIVEEIHKRLASHGEKPYRMEGEHEARWVLLDYLDFVVHVFHTEEREYYGIERLWADAQTVPFEEDAVVARG